jgi:hypothetical protein
MLSAEATLFNPLRAESGLSGTVSAVKTLPTLVPFIFTAPIVAVTTQQNAKHTVVVKKVFKLNLCRPIIRCEQK